MKKVFVLILAAVLLLNCGCTMRIVEKNPAATAFPTQKPTAQNTPVPATPEPTEKTAETAEPTQEPEPEITPEPTEAPQPYAFSGFRRGLSSYDDLTYARPDFDELNKKINNIRMMVTDGTDSDTILSAYESLEEDMKHISTAYAIASLYSAIDVNDEYYKDEAEYLTEKSSEAQVLCTKMEIDIYESEHCDVVFYDWTEADFEYLRIAEKLYDEEYVELNTQLEEITNEYWEEMTNTKVEYKDKEYSQAELEELDIDDTTYYALLNKYYEELNQEVGELYLEMIGIEKRIAQKAGYDSFAAFSYDFDYCRDYSPEDSQTFWAAVKQYAVPMMQELYNGLSYEEYNGLMLAMNSRNQLSKRKSYIETYVAEVSPYMKEAYDYLVEYELSVLTDSETSQAGAYTTFIPDYDVPFIFLHEDGSYSDILTFVHEFGHFYANYMGGYDAATTTSLDVSEICSQANELLFLPYFSQYYKTDAYNGIVKYQMINALYSMITGCLYDEFQQYVYANDVNTVEELNQAYLEISTSYGMGSGYYYVDTEYVWVDVMHNFECPMYYISYATSIVPALQIMDISQTDREEAIRVYNNVVTSDPNMTFTEVLEENGLHSPFEEQTVVDVINAIVDLTGVGQHISLK